MIVKVLIIRNNNDKGDGSLKENMIKWMKRKITDDNIRKWRESYNSKWQK